MYTIFHLATERAYGLGRSSRPPPTPTESHQTRCARRRHCLGRPPRNPASKSHGRLRSGVDLFGRASQGYIANLKIQLSQIRDFLPLLGLRKQEGAVSWRGVQFLEVRRDGEPRAPHSEDAKSPERRNKVLLRPSEVQGPSTYFYCDTRPARLRARM